MNVKIVEECCKTWLKSGIGPDGTGLIVVRAGAKGCLVASRSGFEWMSAFHQDPSRVVDPTGGGNAFLGGLAVCLARAQTSGDLALAKEAAAWGSVAASFAIEQVGMPALNSDVDEETWNGASVIGRLSEYKRRLRA